jgi:hypothetical protein
MTKETNNNGEVIFYLENKEEYSDDYKNYLLWLENEVIKYQNIT